MSTQAQQKPQQTIKSPEKPPAKATPSKVVEVAIRRNKGDPRMWEIVTRRQGPEGKLVEEVATSLTDMRAVAASKLTSVFSRSEM